MHLDFTGSDPQVEAAYNVPTGGKRHVWLTLKLMHFVYSHDKTIPLNHGMFEHITVEAPRGTIVNPTPPAAVGVRAATAIRINEALVGALSTASPGLMPAPSGGVMIPSVLVEQNPQSGARNVMVLQSLVGGTGARDGGDGVDGRDSSLANQRNTPIEKTEEEAAAVIVEYALRQDSGGAGRWRGGTGVVFSVRIVRDGSAVLGRGMERFVFRPWGLAGGQPGATARVIVNVGTADERDARKAGHVRRARRRRGHHHDAGRRRLSATHSSGPLAQVRADVLVRLYLGGGCRARLRCRPRADTSIDEVATQARRATIRATRPALRRFDFGPERDAWDAVFDDASMLELNALLLQLGPSVCSRLRREMIERVVPGLASGIRPLQEAIGDIGEARARLAHEIDALRRDLRGRSATLTTRRHEETSMKVGIIGASFAKAAYLPAHCAM